MGERCAVVRAPANAYMSAVLGSSRYGKHNCGHLLVETSQKYIVVFVHEKGFLRSGFPTILYVHGSPGPVKYSICQRP